MLRRYIAYTRVVDAVKRNALSAMIYPAVLFSLSLLVLFGIMVKVVPAFQDFYGSFRAELPLATRILIAISNLVRSQSCCTSSSRPSASAPSAGRGCGRGPTCVRLHAADPAPARPGHRRHAVRDLAVRAHAGHAARRRHPARVRARGGRPRGRQPHVGAAVETITQQVREGVSLGQAMAERRLFPDVALKMVDVGEQTGALQEMLNAVADFFDESVETKLGRFMKLIEPLMLVIMAIVIAA